MDCVAGSLTANGSGRRLRFGGRGSRIKDRYPQQFGWAPGTSWVGERCEQAAGITGETGRRAWA